MARDTWLARARWHIRAALASIPADASLKDKRAAIRAAYPWGQRSGWPYHCWLRAQQEVIGTSKYPIQKDVTVTPHGIECRFCSPDFTRGGCILCMAARDKLAALPAALVEEWAALEEEAKTDASAKGILADWMEEHWGDMP